MITYADKTKIAIASEAAWGRIPASGYSSLHINAESLTPQIRSLQLGQLSATQPRIRTEEMVSGDIEAPLAAGTLAMLLPAVMLGAEHKHTIQGASVVRFNTSGHLPVSSASLPQIQDNDYIWMQSANDNRTGFHPVVKSASRTYIKGGADKSPVLNPSFTYHRLIGGTMPASATIARRYGTDGAWYGLAGLMIQRLVIDLEEDRPPVVVASLIGRAMEVMASAPAIADTAPSEPLETGQHLKHLVFTDPATNMAVDTHDVVITGIRIVLDRVGMTPQFGLGGVQPRMILPGHLAVSGSVSMLVSGNRLFNWLAGKNRLKLTLMMQSDVSGFVLELPQLEISGVDGGARAADQPIRGVFHFVDNISPGIHGGAGDSSNASPVRFFLKP